MPYLNKSEGSRQWGGGVDRYGSIFLSFILPSRRDILLLGLVKSVPEDQAILMGTPIAFR